MTWSRVMHSPSNDGDRTLAFDAVRADTLYQSTTLLTMANDTPKTSTIPNRLVALRENVKLAAIDNCLFVIAGDNVKMMGMGEFQGKIHAHSQIRASRRSALPVIVWPSCTWPISGWCWSTSCRPSCYTQPRRQQQRRNRRPASVCRCTASTLEVVNW